MKDFLFTFDHSWSWLFFLALCNLYIIKSISCFIIKIGFAFLELFRRRRRRIRQAIYKEWTSITSGIYTLSKLRVLRRQCSSDRLLCVAKCRCVFGDLSLFTGCTLLWEMEVRFQDERHVSRAWRYTRCSQLLERLRLLPGVRFSWYIASFVVLRETVAVD